MDITLIEPKALRSIWPQIKQGLDAMPPEDWIAEDVYHAIRVGLAALYVGVSDSGFAGFFVLTRGQSDYTFEPEMHIWLGYSTGEADVVDEAMDMIRAIARQSGAKRLTFGSPRKGWSKRYPLISAKYEVPL